MRVLNAVFNVILTPNMIYDTSDICVILRKKYISCKSWWRGYHGHTMRIKPVFHFNRIVPKRSVFLCFLSGSVELMTSTQKRMLLKWKTGLNLHVNGLRTIYFEKVR
jgi:hypothetical protein